MRYDEFIVRVIESGGPADQEHAERATTATLELIGQRLTGGEPSNLASQGELDDVRSQLPAGYAALFN